MITAFLLLFLGFVVLIAGAEILVRGASGIAVAFGLSPLVIGLTVVAFGTSSPELAVSVQAAATGTGEIVLGNVVGSNLFNVVVILAITAMICPLKVQLRIIRIDMPLMLLATGVFIAFVVTGGALVRWEAAILTVALLVYLFFLVKLSRREEDQVEVDLPGIPREKPKRLSLSLLCCVVGLALLVGGANLIVDNAVIIAENWGVDETLIGLTIIATGTSLPELATSIVAAVKKQTDLAVGNVVGSNFFNLLCIAGVAGMIQPLPNLLERMDLIFLVVTSVVLLPLMWTQFILRRWEGAVLLAGYVTYLVIRWP